MAVRRQPTRYRGGGRHGRYATVEHAKNPAATLRRVLALLKGRRTLLALLMIPLAITSLTGLIWPRVMGLATDILTLHDPENFVDYTALVKVLAAGALATVIGLLAQVIQGDPLHHLTLQPLSPRIPCHTLQPCTGAARSPL